MTVKNRNGERLAGLDWRHIEPTDGRDDPGAMLCGVFRWMCCNRSPRRRDGHRRPMSRPTGGTIPGAMLCGVFRMCCNRSSTITPASSRIRFRRRCRTIGSRPSRTSTMECSWAESLYCHRYQFNFTPGHVCDAWMALPLSEGLEPGFNGRRPRSSRRDRSMARSRSTETFSRTPTPRRRRESLRQPTNCPHPHAERRRRFPMVVVAMAGVFAALEFNPDQPARRSWTVRVRRRRSTESAPKSQSASRHSKPKPTRSITTSTAIGTGRPPGRSRRT